MTGNKFLVVLLIISLLTTVGSLEIAEVPEYQIGETWNYTDVSVVVNDIVTLNGVPHYHFFYYREPITKTTQSWYSKDNFATYKWFAFMDFNEYLYKPPLEEYKFPLKTGVVWNSSGDVFIKNMINGNRNAMKYIFRGEVEGVEDVSTPAGTFETFKINRYYQYWFEGSTVEPLIVRDIHWWSPLVKYYVKTDKGGVSELVWTNVEYEKPKPQIVILANPIDYGLASDFFGFLRNKGLEIVHATPDDFDQYKNKKFIVILGGPDAYDGVGGIVQEVLSEVEQNSIREAGARKKYVKTNIWSQGQRVTVIAGSDRNETKNTEDENKDSVATEADSSS
ncbi:MAG: hypothetical protein ACE5J5_05130 [Candidatus Hydrothermarchaeales archaeon]